MILRFIIIAIFILLLFGCQNKANSRTEDKYSKTNKTIEKDSYSDNSYCAEVQYHNYNTGTQSSYTLTVKVESNEIVEIDWPNGGKLDNGDFSNAILDEYGHSAFTSDKGYEYAVQIIEQSEKCFNNVQIIKQCKGKTKNGNRCRHMTDNPNHLCWQHQSQE